MEKEYSCLKCNKSYSSSSSLSNHNNKFHKAVVVSTPNLYKCRFCDKFYSIYQSRWFHEQKCKHIIKEKNNTIESIKAERDAYKDKIIKLQDKLIKTNRLTTKSFKAINKILMERSYHMNQSNNNNSLNTTNTVNSNNNILQICNVGSEDILNVLTEQQKKQIMNAKFKSLDKLVEITHCGEYNQFKNIIITNLKDEFAYKYDDSKGFFVTVKKNDVITNMIDYRIYNLNEMYDEMENGNKIDAKTKVVLKRFMDKCDSDDPFEDDNGIKYPNYKEYKKDCVKILLYNNHERITKDIASLIQDNESEKLDNEEGEEEGEEGDDEEQEKTIHLSIDETPIISL